MYKENINFKSYIDKLITNINFKIGFIDGKLKDYKRKKYINSTVTDMAIYDLIFYIGTNNLFKETIAFKITIENDIDFVKISNRYTHETKLFSRYDVNDISNFIVDYIFQFINYKDCNIKEN